MNKKRKELKLEDKEFGLEYVKSMWSNSKSSMQYLAYNFNSEYSMLIDVAQGRQSLDGMKRHLGFINNDLIKEGFSELHLEVLNIAPKYINLIVGKLNKIEYDINVDAIDPISIDYKKRREAQIKSYIKIKSYINQLGLSATQLFPDIDFTELPEAPEELFIEFMMNSKLKKAMDYELKLKECFNFNNWAQIRHEFVWYLVVLGIACVYVEKDKNNKIIIKLISPDKIIYSNSQHEDFRDIIYAGHIEYLNESQLVSELSPEYDEDTIEEIINSYGSNNNYEKYSITQNAMSNQYKNDGLQYYPILRFQFLCDKQEKFVVKRNKYGNISFEKKNSDFSPSNDELIYYESGEKELLNNTLRFKYGGNWIIGSDYIYDYGVKPSPKVNGNKVNATLDYVIYAPNIKYGRITSMLSQIIEPLYMINLSWTKIKDILAKGRMGTLNVRLDKLISANLIKSDGSAMKPKELIDLYMQHDIAITAGRMSPYDNDSGDAFYVSNNGLTLNDYWNTFINAVRQIQNITGINELSDASTPSSNTLIGVMQMANESTNTALDYLYHAYKQIYHATAKNVLEYYQLTEIDNMPLEEFIIGLNKRPSYEEWSNFYATVDRALTAGLITLSDSIFLRNIDNLKQAEQVMIIRENKRKKEAQMEAERNIKMQSEENRTNSILIEKERQTSIIEAHKLEIEKIKIEHANNLELQRLKNEGLILQKETEMQGRIDISRQQGADQIIRQAQKNLSN